MIIVLFSSCFPERLDLVQLQHYKLKVIFRWFVSPGQRDGIGQIHFWKHHLWPLQGSPKTETSNMTFESNWNLLQFQRVIKLFDPDILAEVGIGACSRHLLTLKSWKPSNWCYCFDKAVANHLWLKFNKESEKSWMCGVGPIQCCELWPVSPPKIDMCTLRTLFCHKLLYKCSI